MSGSGLVKSHVFLLFFIWLKTGAFLTPPTHRLENASDFFFSCFFLVHFSVKKIVFLRYFSLGKFGGGFEKRENSILSLLLERVAQIFAVFLSCFHFKSEMQQKSQKNHLFVPNFQNFPDFFEKMRKNEQAALYGTEHTGFVVTGTLVSSKFFRFPKT